MKYSVEIERDMKAFYDSLSEKDRRRYAAIEATKLGQGGTDYIATVLGCDPKTIRRGHHDLAALPDPTSQWVRPVALLDPLLKRIRKKGVDTSGVSKRCPSWRRTFCGCFGTTRRATRCERASGGPI
jgi:hypothetical protein